MQILERQGAAKDFYTPALLGEVQKGCTNWDKWFSDPANLWAKNATIFQDDSGI